MGALAPADREEIVDTDAVVVGFAQDRQRRVVLLPAVYAVGEPVVGIDPVDLRGRLVVDARPGLAAIEGYRGAAVVGVDHVPVVVGIDPVIVMVAVGRLLLFERDATVDRFHERRVEHVDDVLVHRVRRDVHVIPGARPEDARAVLEFPRLAAVVAAVKAALAGHGLDDRVQPLRVTRGDVDADLADQFR